VTLTQRIDRFDAWLLTGKIEPFCWWSEYRFGLNSFKIARVFNYLGAGCLACALMLLPRYAADNTYLLPPWIILSVASFLWLGVENLTKSAQRKCSGGINPERNDSLARFMCGFIVLPLVIYYFFLTLALLVHTSSTTWMCVLLFIAVYSLLLYLLACNPMPPKWKPKIKEKARSLELVRAG
jgi:hypothetical protein